LVATNHSCFHWICLAKTATGFLVGFWPGWFGDSLAESLPPLGLLRFRVRLSGSFVTLIFVGRCHVSFIGIAFFWTTRRSNAVRMRNAFGKKVVRVGRVAVDSLARSCRAHRSDDQFVNQSPEQLTNLISLKRWVLGLEACTAKKKTNYIQIRFHRIPLKINDHI